MAEDLTVVVLTLDEEARVAPTLGAARRAECQVLVVDGGSTDRTVEVARSHGCTVYVRQFDGFAAQRNWALAQVLTRYALFVDADELVHPKLMEQVRRAVHDGVDGAWIPTLDYFAGRWMVHGGWYPQPHLRLLETTVARFEGRVHEQVRFSVPEPNIVSLSEPLLHRSHLTVSDYLRKLDRYTTIEAQGTPDGRPSALVVRGLAEASAVLGCRILVQRGWRDGVHGIIGAILYAVYRFTIYAKAATRLPVDPDTSEAALDRLRRRQRR